MDIRTKLRMWKTIVDSRDEYIVEAYRGGITVTEIAELMGMGKATVYRVLKREGIDIGELHTYRALPRRHR